MQKINPERNSSLTFYFKKKYSAGSAHCSINLSDLSTRRGQAIRLMRPGFNETAVPTSIAAKLPLFLKKEMCLGFIVQILIF